MLIITSLLLSIIAGLISLGGTIPYFLDTLRGKTKPRVASWLMWAILTGIACGASFADEHYPAAGLALCMTLACGAIVALGFIKNGRLSLETFDVGCFLIALAGLLLWQIFRSPQLAIVMVVAVDAVASLPTLRHAWKAPHEETLIEFFTAAFASCLTLVAGNSWQLTAIGYPAYIILFDAAVVVIILRGRSKIKYNKLDDVA